MMGTPLKTWISTGYVLLDSTGSFVTSVWIFTSVDLARVLRLMHGRYNPHVPKAKFILKYGDPNNINGKRKI
jgi:hypothetical protein